MGYYESYYAFIETHCYPFKLIIAHKTKPLTAKKAVPQNSLFCLDIILLEQASEDQSVEEQHNAVEDDVPWCAELAEGEYQVDTYHQQCNEPRCYAHKQRATRVVGRSAESQEQRGANGNKCTACDYPAQ